MQGYTASAECMGFVVVGLAKQAYITIMQMKTSQTWNQGFEDMRLDSHHTGRHQVSEELSDRDPVGKSMFDSLELPPESHYQHPHQGDRPSHPRSEDSDPRPTDKYEYSQTDQNPSISDQRPNEQPSDQRTPRLLDRPHPGQPPPPPTTPPKEQRNRSPPVLSPPPLQLRGQSPMQPLPPHYPPSPHVTHMAVVRQPVLVQDLKSLDSIRNPTQQSLAPSQKTVVGHMGTVGQVSHSRVETEKMGTLRHSLIHERRVNSPNMRINFDYGTPREGVIVRNAMFNSYIPPSQVIPERVCGSSSNGPLLSERHHHDQAFGEAAHWKEKYEEASRRWEMAKLKEGREVEVLGGKFRALEQNYAQLQVAYEQLMTQYHAKLDENERYFQQIQQLQNALSHRPAQDSEKMARLLKEREEEISKLANKVEELSSPKCEHEVSIMSQTTKNGTHEVSAMQTALQQKSMLIAFLKAENQQLSARLQEMTQKYEQELRDMNEQGVLLQMELEQRDNLLQAERDQREQENHREFDNTRSVQENTRSAQDNPRQLALPPMKRSDNSQMLLQRSRMQSFDNNSRVMQLQMHIGKLNSELNLRDQAYQRELKMANLKIAELIDRLKGATNEKDQMIRTLQEKAALLESDLNKKDSIVRNLKDQLALVDHKRPREVNVYSSAVNAMDHRVGEVNEEFRRELDGLRKNVFEREREKLSLRQKLEELEEKLLQSEESLSKKKIENQNIRRQLNEYDNLQHENEKLMEVLSKKNGDLMEMREMLLEKEQHTGEYEILSKENEKLRDIMVKKNEELSEMADKLYNEQKRTRELAAAHDLNEEIERLQDILARKDVEINKYSQSLQLAEANYSDIEFELERQKNVNEEYEAVIRANRSRLQEYEEEFNKLEQINQNYEQEICRMAHDLESLSQELSNRSTNEQHVKNQLESTARELEEKIEEIEQHIREGHQLRQFKEKSTKEIESIENKQVEALRQHQYLINKCKELENALKQRDQRLHKAEKELEQTRERYKKHHDCDKQIEFLTEKVSDYQMKVLRLNMNRSFGANYMQVENSHVFENQVIYQLKRENELLKQQQPHQHLHHNQQPQNLLEESRQSPAVGGAVKNRLDEFHQKLHSTIHRVTSEKDLHRHTSSKTLPERSQQALLEQQNRQIQRLKTLAQQMQRQQLLKSQREGSSGSSSKHITAEYIEMVYQQQLSFYKSKNDQLEERINSHIKVNRDLKFTLDNLLRNKDNSFKEFYESELKRVNEVNSQLERENKQLKNEVKRAQSNSSNPNNQSSQSNRSRPSELEMMAMKGRELDGPYRFTLKTHFDNWQEPMH